MSLANTVNKMTRKRTTLGAPQVLKQVGFKTVCSMDTMPVTLPGIYRPSRNKDRNNTKEKGPPNTKPKKKPHEKTNKFNVN